MKLAKAAAVLCLLTVGLCACSSQTQPASKQGGFSAMFSKPAVAYEIFDDINPYTGLEKAPDYPEGKRGLAVMVDNVRGAWPQCGLNAADLVYEMVTESGITHLMTVYRDYAKMPTVGPVQSARDQHIQLMIPLDALYAHVGSSSIARDYLEVYKLEDRKSIDGKHKNFYWIDAERSKTKGRQDSVYTDGPTFASAAQQYGLETQSDQEPMQIFNFVRYDQPRRELTGGSANQVYLRFSGYADSLFTYDPESGKYYKEQFGEPQLDLSDGGQQYRTDNVFLLFANIEKYPDGALAHIRFDERHGSGLYFSGGRYERVRWIKEDPASPLRIVDNEDTEKDIQVNPGSSYIAVIENEQISNCRIDDKTLEETFDK